MTRTMSGPGVRSEGTNAAVAVADRGGIAPSLERFVAAFNGNDLDTVMTFFADDAIYCPGDGRTLRGRAAIREAFRPQFEGTFGEMFFAVDDVVVDEPRGKASIRWICHHDLTGTKGRNIPLLQRLLYRLLYGSRFGWRGTDLFHFDGQGRISAKHTFASYKRPFVSRGLARPAE